MRTMDPSIVMEAPRYFRVPRRASRSPHVEILIAIDVLYGTRTRRLSTRRKTRSFAALWSMIASLPGYESFTRTLFPSGSFGTEGTGRSDIFATGGRVDNFGARGTVGGGDGGASTVLDHFGV